MIDIDLKYDIGNIAKKMFHKRGIKPNADWDARLMCIKLYDIRHRRFDFDIPYAVVISDKLKKRFDEYAWATDVMQSAINTNPKMIKPLNIKPLEDFLLRLKTNNIVTMYLGADVNKISVDKSDFQLKNWNIYHAHLDLDIAKMKYTGGKNAELLFFQVKERVVHLIDIKHHPYGSDWFDPDLLKTVNRNWPWLLIDLKGVVSLDQNISNDEYYELSKRVVGLYPLENGRCLCPSTLGVATSGDSIQAVLMVNDLFRKLNQFEKMVRSKEKEIRIQYKEIYKEELPDNIEFHLKISSEHEFYLQLSDSKSFKINMFPVPDIFYERVQDIK